MLFNTQRQVVKLTLQEQIACRDANTLQQHLDKSETPTSPAARAILARRVNILKPLREKLWPSGDKPDQFFRLMLRARLV